MRSLVELLKSLIKVTIVGYFIYTAYNENLMSFPNLALYSVQDAAEIICDLCFGLALKASMALVALGFADFLYQWYDYEKNLRMSKQEIKDEYKLTEGDPAIKGRIREKQQELARSRMMAAVPQADVVVTNPTHYAIALKYDDKVAAAPVVLAKGKDLVAQRIKELAREHSIPMVENKPVAQALYLTVDIGQQIPGDLFVAVAEIMAYVYKLKNPAPRPAPKSTPAARSAEAPAARPPARAGPGMSNIGSLRR